MIEQPKELYTVAEFCSTHGIGRTTLYGEVKAGRLRLVKIGTASRIRRIDAQAWVAALPSDTDAA